MTPGATSGRADDLAFLVRGRDVRDLRDGLDDRLLEFRLRILAVVDEIEAVGNHAGLERLAVARGERGAELGLVGVGRLVQIDVQEEASAQRRDEAQQRRGLLGGAPLAERAIRIDGVRVPAMDPLVSPRAHARHHDHVDRARVVGRAPLDELQRAVHAARLVAVHAARHEHDRADHRASSAAHREQTVAIRRIVELTVLCDIEARRQRSIDVTTSSG